jgi:hypothetical protein
MIPDTYCINLVMFDSNSALDRKYGLSRLPSPSISHMIFAITSHVTWPALGSWPVSNFWRNYSNYCLLLIYVVMYSLCCILSR